jgi:O-antigen/teichoic acid export membrane protein
MAERWASRFRWSPFRTHLASGAAAMVVSAIVQIILARIILNDLGAETYGLWAVLSTVMVVGAFGDQGLGDSLVRHIAVARSKEDQASAQAYYASAMLMALFLGIFFAGLTYACRYLILDLARIDTALQSTATLLLTALALLLIPYVLNVVACASLSGLNRIDIRNYIMMGSRVMQLLGTIVCIRLNWGIWAIFAGQLAFQCLSLTAALQYIRSKGRIRPFSLTTGTLSHAKDIVRMGSHMVLARILNLGMFPVMRIALSRYLGLEAVTVFDIADKLLAMVRSILMSGLKAIVPRVSTSHSRGLAGIKDTDRMNRKMIHAILLVATPAFLLLLLTAKPLLLLWLENGYDPRIISCLQIMVVPYFINLLVLPQYFSLIGWGRTNIVSFIALVTVVFFLSFLALAISSHNHLRGYLLAYGISMGLGACLMPILYQRALASEKAIAKQIVV